MAITPADLLAPTGPVETLLFPGEVVGDDMTTLEDRLQSYITQAETKNAAIGFADPDAADKAWALYLTFQAAYLIACARPSTENAQVEILGSQSYSKDQRDALLSRAQEYRDEYTDLLNAVPSTSTPVGIPSRSTPIVYDW